MKTFALFLGLTFNNNLAIDEALSFGVSLLIM